MSARVAVLTEDAYQRGDRYALACLRTGLCANAWLAADAPDEARRGAEDAVRNWTHAHGFHLQHYWAMYALSQCDLYEGNASAAYERVWSQWKPFRRSLLLGMQAVQIEAHHLRARVTLAAAAQRGEPGLLRSALRDARTIEGSGPAWGRPLANDDPRVRRRDSGTRRRRHRVRRRRRGVPRVRARAARSRR